MSRTTIEHLKEIGHAVEREFQKKVGRKDFKNFQFSFNSNYQTFFATALVDGEGEVEHFIEFRDLPVFLPKDEPVVYSPFDREFQMEFEVMKERSPIGSRDVRVEKSEVDWFLPASRIKT